VQPLARLMNIHIDIETAVPDYSSTGGRVPRSVCDSNPKRKRGSTHRPASLTLRLTIGPWIIRAMTDPLDTPNKPARPTPTTGPGARGFLHTLSHTPTPREGVSQHAILLSYPTSPTISRRNTLSRWQFRQREPTPPSINE
jgi:hypothetical protein